MPSELSEFEARMDQLIKHTFQTGSNNNVSVVVQSVAAAIDHLSTQPGRLVF